MKAKDLYLLPSESESNDLSYLKGHYYNHVPELGDDWFVHEGNEKIVIKTIKEFHFDSRRFWALRTVWFEGKPVMVIQNAGREGDDHAERFITSKDLYRKMTNYIKSIIYKEQEDEIHDLIGQDDELPSLTSFYDNNLDGYFERY